jgi:hypothetical protein
MKFEKLIKGVGQVQLQATRTMSILLERPIGLIWHCDFPIVGTATPLLIYSNGMEMNRITNNQNTTTHSLVKNRMEGWKEL